MNDQNLEKFLNVSDQFRLGSLTTESPHPLTIDLSSKVKTSAKEGVSTLKDVDILALEKLCDKIDLLKDLHFDIANTIKNGGRIFLCGCGATGRLALALEFIWRKTMNGPTKDKVVSFMAGGDCALIASIEKFEDFPDFGSRQLMDLGFNERDLLVAITEGGETPFVIGATEKAVKIARNQPYFIYCNPDHVLCQVAERSKKVIENHQIKKINLEVGPMAITGSTRMQATTVQMLSVGSALLNYKKEFSHVESELLNFYEYLRNFKLTGLHKFVEKESSIYEKGEFIFYEADEDYAISILTDTTERSPTFSLFPFENVSEFENPSLCYLTLPNNDSAQEAWANILGREPRTFHWPDVTDRTTSERLYGYDISKNIIEKRAKYLNGRSHNFKIIHRANHFNFELDQINQNFMTDGLSFLSKHILLKLILNNLSTCIMGRLSRYEGNVMTWVRPSNYKLIDRSIRYVQLMLEQHNQRYPYEHVAAVLFKLFPSTPSSDSLTIRVFNELVENERHLMK